MCWLVTSPSCYLLVDASKIGVLMVAVCFTHALCTHHEAGAYVYKQQADRA
jgi:hypothetical protein